jgi:dipeptidase E
VKPHLKEFHAYNTIPVLGLREGSWLKVDGDQVIVKGNLSQTFQTKSSLKSLKPELISVTSNKTKTITF